jgi:hypothetical protein
MAPPAEVSPPQASPARVPPPAEVSPAQASPVPVPVPVPVQEKPVPVQESLLQERRLVPPSASSAADAAPG